jgi:hypothetical protein
LRGHPVGIAIHRPLEVARVLVAVDAERRRQVRVAERLRRGLDAGDAAELLRERVARLVHVQSARDARADQPRRLRLAIPPAMHRLGGRLVLREGAQLADYLALAALAGGVGADRVEQKVVALRGPSDVGKLG